MTKSKRLYDINALIGLLGDQMDAVHRLSDDDRPLTEQLKLLDTLGKTCSRLAVLIGQQRKLQGEDSAQLSEMFQQVLNEMRKQG